MFILIFFPYKFLSIIIINTEIKYKNIFALIIILILSKLLDIQKFYPDLYLVTDV